MYKSQQVIGYAGDGGRDFNSEGRKKTKTNNNKIGEKSSHKARLQLNPKACEVMRKGGVSRAGPKLLLDKHLGKMEFEKVGEPERWE